MHLCYLTKRISFLQAAERVMVYMGMTYINSGNHCSFTVSNEEVTSTSPLVWNVPKHWRYTNAVNDKFKI